MKKTVLIFFTLIISTQVLVAQNLKKANSLFEKRSYAKAIELFLDEEVKTQEVIEKLGDSYFFNSQMAPASKWYRLLLKEHENDVDPIYYFRYSQTLKGLEQYDEADKWYNKYSGNDTQTLSYFESLNDDIKRPYIVRKISANTEVSDFGVSFYNDMVVVFASARGDGKAYAWNNQPYLSLYIATVNENGDFDNAQLFSEEVTTKMHEANAIFTKDGNTMYFTRNNFIGGKKKKDADKVTNLKIYKAELVEGIWANITELPFNSDAYSVEHPALSPDEKQLYFASDMPGTVGSFDIFVVNIENGGYGSPKNLGETINTPQREQFPFISSNNTLYFASNGHVGLGGLDIFKSEFSDAAFSTPLNLSTKINSNFDDFAFIIDEEKETGYFSSNRKGGMGDDDIYRFTQLRKYFVKGLVQDKNSLELLPGSLITLFDGDNNSIDDMIVGDDAKYTFEIFNNEEYKIRATRKLYIPSDVEFSTDNEGNIDKDILLSLESYEDAEKAIIVENGKTQIKIDPIYFDFDKWNIRPDAAQELDNVVVLMIKYPDMQIEVGAHTDSRGRENYNLKLSHKRADAVREYLVSQGVLDDNVKSVGYGEMQPLNNCDEDNSCTEEDHDLNRRCEFVILN